MLQIPTSLHSSGWQNVSIHFFIKYFFIRKFRFAKLSFWDSPLGWVIKRYFLAKTKPKFTNNGLLHGNNIYFYNIKIKQRPSNPLFTMLYSIKYTFLRGEVKISCKLQIFLNLTLSQIITLLFFRLKNFDLM